MHKVLWYNPVDTFGIYGPFVCYSKCAGGGIRYICIQNVLLAKGAGDVKLPVQLRDMPMQRVYYRELYTLDSYAQQIENLLGIELRLPEPLDSG